MQYLKKDDGTFGLLPKQNVDFGGGLERIAAVSEGVSDVFIANYRPILAYLEAASGKKYAAVQNEVRAFRIVADHMKAATFLIGDGVEPGNAEQGYFVRRLIRRAVRYADTLGIQTSTLSGVVAPIAQMYREQYPELLEKSSEITHAVAAEEERFRQTLARGMRELERFVEGGAVSAEGAFQLFTTYGFPLELIIEEAGAKGIKQIDVEGFKELLKQHQELSRAGSEQKFKGGLADTSAQTVRLHTAHHLLLKALQIVLGPSVHQRGSNITGERLRIDFNWARR